jgi:hypothetical protein
MGSEIINKPKCRFVIYIWRWAHEDVKTAGLRLISVKAGVNSAGI